MYLNTIERLSRRTLTVCLLLALASSAAIGADTPRERRNFDFDWRFHKGDVENAQAVGMDASGWRELNLPHDWSIEGPHSAGLASGTGFLPGGIGWYRKAFTLPESMNGRMVFIEFDGIYRDSDVWINGEHLGHRPFGYASFEYDLTPHLKFGDEANVLAVKVDHTAEADSRWYTGSGIYRHVWLNVTDPIHVEHWGTYVTTPAVRESDALVTIETEVLNESDSDRPVRITTSFLGPDGAELLSDETTGDIAASEAHTFVQQVELEDPKLWDIDDPNLYTAVTRLYVGDEQVDEYETPFGIRTFRFHPQKGFSLNGRSMKLKGVCLHHDLGALGAAFAEAPLKRRFELMKKIGANALRAAHNPMSPEFYDLADRMGFVVMDEAFDEWIGGKRKWVKGWNAGTPSQRGYHEVFEEWSERDVEMMVKRSRNHPSIIMWSIGNEIDYPTDPFSHPRGRDGFVEGTLSANLTVEIGRRLLATVKRLDPTRPVTLASADINASNATGLADLLDVVGYNYQEQFYERDHRDYPDRIILGSENGDSIGAWRAVALNDWVSGQFLWTGIDFWGESGRFPHRGSNAGLFDYCGYQKPIGYFREALWSEKPMVYAVAWGPTTDDIQLLDWQRGRRRPLAEHWNWSDDSRQRIPVEVYSNCDSVQLLLNGQPQREKRISDRTEPVLFWTLPNEPGVVEAVGKIDGKVVARYQLKTASQPARVELTPDRDTIHSDGADLATVEVMIVDAEGVRVANASHNITFAVEGVGELAAVDNPDPRDINPVQAAERKAYQGRALAIVRAGSRPGRLTITATAAGIEPGQATIVVK
jgi:beta-galactosidase